MSGVTGREAGWEVSEPTGAAGDLAVQAPPPGSSTTRKALGNSAFLASYYTFDAGMLFALNLLLARGLGITAYGTLAFALSCGLLLAALDPGFNLAITKLVARDPRPGNPWIATGLSLRLGFTSAVVLLSVIPLTFNSYMRSKALFIAVVAGSELVRSLSLGCCAVFRGFQSMGWEALVFGIERSTLLLGSAVLLHRGHGLSAIGFMFLAARGVALLVGIVVLRIKAGRIRLSVWPENSVEMLREAYPLTLLSLSGTLNLYLPPVLLTFIVGEAAAGMFQAAVKIMMFPLLVCSVIGMGVFPAMSATYEDSAQLQKLYGYAVRLLWHCLLPCAIMTTFFAGPMVRTFFGPQYAGAAGVLQLLTPCYLLQVIVTMGYYVLTAVNRQKLTMRLGLISVVINVVLGVVMMKFYGPYGEAFTFTVTNAVIAGCYWHLTGHHDVRSTTARHDVLQWVGFAVMITLCFWIAPRVPVRGWTQLVVAGLACLAAYAAILLLSGGVLPQEWRLLASAKDRLWGRA